MRIKKRSFIIYIVIVSLFLALVGYAIYWLDRTRLPKVGTALISIYIINLFITIFIFMQIRQVNAKLSWLMVFAIIPIFGQAIFIIFGQRYKNVVSYDQYMSKGYIKYEKFRDNANSELNYYSNLANRGIYKGDFTLYDEGGIAYNQIFEDMENAKSFIHIHLYIIKPGDIYEKFKDLLLRKAKQGIEVRLIVDDFGRWAMPWYEINELENKGVQIKIFGKVHFPFIGSNNGFRTHRKLIIIDGKYVHLGGMNISDEYVSLSKKYGKWNDIQMRITGGSTISPGLLFLEDWKEMSKIKLDVNKYIDFTNNTGNNNSVMVEGTPQINFPVMENAIITLIRNAKKSIYISTPYLIPSEDIMLAIITAALSGVEVIFYIPDIYDKKIANIGQNFYADQLIKSGIKFRKMNGMFIHSKMGLFDKKIAYIGTANIDMRSMYSQFEVIDIVEGKSVISQIKTLFNEYHLTSYETAKDEFKLRGIKKVIRKFLILLLNSMM